GAQSHAMANDYQKNIDVKNKLLNELNARRRDRVDQITKKGTTFLGIVEDLRDRAVREHQGRHLELVRLAKENKKNLWRKPIKFADSTTDCILMDENSEIAEREIVRISDDNSIYTELMIKSKDKRILLIDDDNKRVQFFQTIF